MVLDTDEDHAAQRLREAPDVDRIDHMSQVQQAGGRWREACDDWCLEAATHLAEIRTDHQLQC